MESIYVVGLGEEDRGQYDVPKEVAWVTRMGMLIEASVFERVRLIDQRAFAHHYADDADADFSMRAKKEGFNPPYEPSARIWHKVGEYDPKVRHTQPSLRQIIKDFGRKSTNKDLRIVWRFYARHCPKQWLWISFPTRVLFSLLLEMKAPKG